MKKKIYQIKSVAQAHQMLNLPKPLHPLISILHHAELQLNTDFENETFTMDLYLIGLKDGELGSFLYGRNSYDYDCGTMLFISPNQVFSPQNLQISNDSKGWTILFHPDLIRKSKLGQTIGQYTYFSYESHEALHISESEKQFITQLAKTIEIEYSQNIDRHTQELIIINIESILKYCKRYYDRQFYTRTNLNKDFIIRFEQYLKDYFTSDQLTLKGIPTVQQCGAALAMSGHYLSDLLKSETGKSAKEYIDLKLVEKAKNRLLNTDYSISEIVYDLGFEYPNHFSKLFKSKTGLSPSEYRNLN